MSKHKHETPACVIYTCCGSKCKKRGGKQLFKDLKTRIKESKARKFVQVIKTGCTDRCKFGPIVAVMPHNSWHYEVSTEKASNILADCLARIQHPNIENT